MTFFQTLIMAIVQGITELFPISSVAHGVLTPWVFNWKLDPVFLKEHFLPYVVMLHLGTALALLIYFWRDWVEVIRSLFTGDRKDSRRLLVRLIIGTVPAAVLGLLLEKKLTAYFGNVTGAAIFLILNGFLLFLGERSRTRGHKEITDLTLGQSFIIGLFQSLALIPGFSRSGASMTAGFWMGLKNEAAARFSMLLATPIIAGASLLELPKLAKAGSNGLFQTSLLGGLFAGIFALISVMILMRWFKTREVNAMRPFAYYCWVIGVVVLVVNFVK